MAAGLLATVAATSANAEVLYQSASYTGIDNGEYILTSDDLIGAVFTLSSTSSITGIGAQFGGYPSGNIFGAIVPLGSPSAFPAGASSNLASISLADVVFGVPAGTQDLIVPLSVTLQAGTYAVIFGSGQFGATGWAGLGDGNVADDSANLIRSFFSDDWASFGSPGVRIVVEGTVAAVPEASTWAMLILGFAGIGITAYRRRTLVAA